MPITYATPEPFAPGISSAYGAAQQWSQDAPGIISASNAANQFAAANAERADRLRFAYAQANAEMQDRTAQRYFQSDAANMDRQQQAYNLGATLTQRNDELSAELQARADQQVRGAELQNWLGQQDLSQKETMRLQQMKAAVADVQASNLTPQQKQDAIMKLRTGIDPLEQRLKTSQAKMVEQHGQLYQAQLEQEAQATELRARVNNMTAGQRIHYEVPPMIADQIEAAVNRSDLSPQERDREIARLKRMHPAAQQFVIEPTGVLREVKRDQPEQPKFDLKAAETFATARAEALHPPTTNLEGKETRSAEFYKAKFDALMEYQQQHNRAAGQPEPEPRNNAIDLPPQAVPVAPKDPQPEFDRADAKRNPEKLTPLQQNIMAKWDSARPLINESEALTAEQKKSHLEHVEWAEQKLAEFGSLHAMATKAPLDYRRYMAILTAVANVDLARKKPEPPAAPRPAAAPVPIDRGGLPRRAAYESLNFLRDQLMAK